MTLLVAECSEMPSNYVWATAANDCAFKTHLLVCLLQNPAKEGGILQGKTRRSKSPASLLSAPEFFGVACNNTKQGDVPTTEIHCSAQLPLPAPPEGPGIHNW